MGETAPRGTLGTVFNAARVLQELSTGPAYQQLTDLAERSGMSLPTVHRLLRSLVVAGMVEQHPRTSRYGLGPELVRLSEQYLSRLPVLRAARPYLGELRNLTKGTVTVSILVGEEVVHVDRIDGEDVSGVFRDATKLRPAMSCAAGQVLLAHADPAPHAGDRAGQGRTAPGEEEFARWRTVPYLVRHDDDVTALADVAAPIRDAEDRVVAALSVTGSQTLFGEEAMHRDVAPHLLRTATAISQALGGE